MRPGGGRLYTRSWRAGAADILSPSDPSIPGPELAAWHAKALPRRLRESRGRGPVFYRMRPGRKCRVSITSPRFTLGRGLGNNLSLSQMGGFPLSRRSAGSKREYLLRDLGSKLGLYKRQAVCNKQVDGRRRVQLAVPREQPSLFTRGHPSNAPGRHDSRVRSGCRSAGSRMSGNCSPPSGRSAPFPCWTISWLWW